MLRRLALLFLLGCFLWSPNPSAGVDAPGKDRKQPAIDSHGDPLPSGAVARLGTVRFRHTGQPKAVAFAPDGSTLVSAVEGDALCFWNAADGRLQRRIADGSPSGAVGYSPDGKLLASAGWLREENRQVVGAVRFWDALTGKVRRTFKYSDREVPTSLVFTPDGKTILTAHSDGTVRAHDAESGKELRRRTFPMRPVSALALAPDGARVALATEGLPRIFLWKWQTPDEPTALTAPSRGALALAFSPDGKILATGSSDDTGVRVWDANTGRLLRELPSSDGSNYTQGVAFSPDGKVLAATDADNGVILWNARTWAELRRLPTSGDRVGAIAFARDALRLTAATESGVRLWEVATGKALAEPAAAHRGEVTGVAFSAQPGVVVTASHDHTVRFWDAATGRQRRVIRHGPWVSFALSPDGKRLVTAAHDDTVRLWDAATGRQLFKLYGHGKYGSYYHVHFLPDSERFVSWGQDRYLRMWRAANGKALLEHPIRAGGLQPSVDDDPDEAARDRGLEKGIFLGRAAFSPDGTSLVLPLGDRLHVLDLATGKEVRHFVSQRGNLFDLAISPNSRWLLAGHDSVLSLLNLGTGKTWRRILLPEGRVSAVAFSPSGKFFAAGVKGRRGQIRIYEVASGELARTLEGFDGSVRHLAFAPDGRLLASALDDTTVLIWDLARSAAGR